MEKRVPTENAAPMAAGFEAALAVLAMALGWILDVEPLQTLTWQPSAIGWGLLAALPMFAVLLVIVQLPAEPFRRLLKIVDEIVVTLFRQASIFDLAIVSLMAGIGEEVLFRGVVQTALAEWTGAPWSALLASGLVFGLMHSVTRTYALLAAIVGVFLGWLWLVTGNLLAPITAHAVYDFGALWYLRRTAAARAEVIETD